MELIIMKTLEEFKELTIEEQYDLYCIAEAKRQFNSKQYMKYQQISTKLKTALRNVMDAANIESEF